jgi:alpha-tubulin suppressor-like RCC1 family protein
MQITNVNFALGGMNIQTWDPPNPPPRYLWSWGRNAYYGQLGLGDTAKRSSPVQVGALPTWLNVAAGDGHSLAVKTDGTIWAWGNNNAGQLGLGNTTDLSSPVVKYFHKVLSQFSGKTKWYVVDVG